MGCIYSLNERQSGKSILNKIYETIIPMYLTTSYNETKKKFNSWYLTSKIYISSSLTIYGCLTINVKITPGFRFQVINVEQIINLDSGIRYLQVQIKPINKINIVEGNGKETKMSIDTSPNFLDNDNDIDDTYAIIEQYASLYKKETLFTNNISDTIYVKYLDLDFDCSSDFFTMDKNDLAIIPNYEFIREII